MLRTGHIAGIVDGVFPYLVHAVLVILTVSRRDAEIEVVDVVGIQSHAAAVALLRGVPVLMECVTSVLHPGVLPRRAVPTGIPIDVCGLGTIDMRISHNGMLVGIEGNLPHPVADIGRFIHNGGGILAGIRVRHADIEHPAADHAQLRAVEVAQDGTVAVIDVNHVEVEPVGHLVVRMPGGV